MSDSPLFASSREALTFAANFKATAIQPPVMNRMLVEMQQADEAVQKAERRGLPPPGLERLTSLDKAGQAGYILQMVGRMNDNDINVMLAAVLRPRDICTCRAPCCCGYRANKDWHEAARYVDEHVYLWLKEHQQAGRKAAYTLTAKLRMELVVDFFDRAMRRTKPEIAALHGISEATVAAHQKRINGHLTGLVRSAFTRLDDVLVAAGIVGSTE